MNLNFGIDATAASQNAFPYYVFQEFEACVLKPTKVWSLCDKRLMSEAGPRKVRLTASIYAPDNQRNRRTDTGPDRHAEPLNRQLFIQLVTYNAMPGEAGANRTFRSIFGDQKTQHDQVLMLEKESDNSASIVANTEVSVAMDDDDEALWNDEMPLDGSTSAYGNNDRLGLQFAQLKSMEEWADGEDEEENWKDALQDRVNQLELVLQNRNDAAGHDVDQQQKVVAHGSQNVDFSQSLPASRQPSPGAVSKQSRHMTRHKMQRTSSLHACITSDMKVTYSPQYGLWNNQSKGTKGKAGHIIHHDTRTRATSVDFVARNIETVEQYCKRSDSLSGLNAFKTNSPQHSLSRKKLTNSNHTSPCQRNSDCARVSKTIALASPKASVSHLSETEAIRRFVLDDIKMMSMERLVSDAQRLHYLESYFKTRQGSGATPSITTSTFVAPTSPASSSSPMSTS
ncbi:hypothetical protein Plhal304r1_c042g0121261 [Plasmopara halstedii]